MSLFKKCLASIAIAAFTFSVQAGSPPLFDEVVDLESYLGLWYEHARTPNPFEDNTIERDGVEYGNCFNTTATYTQRNRKSINVDNLCQRVSANGDIIEAGGKGVADLVKGSNNQKLKVAFGPLIARIFQRVKGKAGDYWIYALGPINADGLYSWSLVSDPAKRGIFVLTREQFPSDELQDEILVVADDLGLPVDKLIFRQFR